MKQKDLEKATFHTLVSRFHMNQIDRDNLSGHSFRLANEITMLLEELTIELEKEIRSDGPTG